MNKGLEILAGLIFLGILGFLFVNYQDAVKSWWNYSFSQDTHQIFIAEKPLMVTVADTPETRRQGLSGQTDLGRFSGKFFIFDEDDLHGIWMKDMKFAIDILWFNNQLELIYIESNVTPDSYPTVFYPNEPARFVLETNARFAEALDLNIGDRLHLPAQLLPADIKDSLQR